MVLREGSGVTISRRFWRSSLVVAWVVAVGVLAFLVTSGAAGSTAQHAARPASTRSAGDPRFATETNAAAAQYKHHRRHHETAPSPVEREHHGAPPQEQPAPSQQPEQVASTSQAPTQGGLPFTGENVLEVIALGLLLAGGGLLLVRRLRRQAA